jgi:uncharacterized protein
MDRMQDWSSRQRNGNGVTVEPRVEDLLASIRKAIDDEDTPLPVNMTVEEPGKITRGSIRDMRLAYDNPPATVRSAPPDIDALRARVARTNAASGFSPLPPPRFRVTVTPAEEQRSSAFTEILAGRESPPPKVPTTPPVEAAAPQPREPDYIRRSHADVAYDDEIANLLPQDVQDSQEPEFAAEDEHNYFASPEPPPLPPHNPFAPPLQHFVAPPAPQPPPPHNYHQQTALVSQASAQNTRRAFDDLSSAIMSRATSERDFEDMTRDMLRNYLGRWLDDNLPSLVEKLVREEIERVARHGN